MQHLHGPVPKALLRPVLLMTVSALLATSFGSTAGAGTRNRSASGSEVAADVASSLAIQTLPTVLAPPLASASTDTALIGTPSLSNCNIVDSTIVESRCVFGDTKGKHTMFLWGDSHALMWFPALDAVAKAAHWKLVALMAYGCPVADVAVWDNLTRTVYGACDLFRARVVAIINRLKPQLVVVAEAFTGYAASGRGAPDTISPGQWRAGLEKSLRLIHARKMNKVVLGSTISGAVVSPPECLAANPTSVATCTVTDTPAQQAQRSAESTAAKVVKALYVNTLPWMCSTSVVPQECAPIISDATNGDMIVYYASGHLTETYDLFLQGVLAAALRHVMR
jgi:SGNH domain (fused to AT3 domains)